MATVIKIDNNTLQETTSIIRIITRQQLNSDKVQLEARIAEKQAQLVTINELLEILDS